MLLPWICLPPLSRNLVITGGNAREAVHQTTADGRSFGRRRFGMGVDLSRCEWGCYGKRPEINNRDAIDLQSLWN